MKLYNEQISNVIALLNEKEGRKLDVQNAFWPEVSRQNLVLRSEMSYELGAGTLPAVNFLGVTSSKELVSGNDAVLYGQDLDQISRDTPYARITLLQVEDAFADTGQAIYDTIRRIEKTRYQVNPKGFMNRISTSSNHEPVRISKAALEEGLNFSKVAKMYMDAYLAHPEVIGVQVIFITLPDFYYGELTRLAQKKDQITAALDHILRDIKMDCSSCKLQTICNEVEGMRELHFKG